MPAQRNAYYRHQQKAREMSSEPELPGARAVEPSRITIRARAHIQSLELKIMLFLHSKVAPQCSSSFTGTMCVIPLANRDTIWQAGCPKCSFPSCRYDLSPGASKWFCHRWFCQFSGHRWGAKRLLFEDWTRLNAWRWTSVSVVHD